MSQQPPGIRARICALAAAKADIGISSADIATTVQGINPRHVGEHCRDLCKQHRLFRAAVIGHRLRWFATVEQRDAFVKHPPPAPKRIGSGVHCVEVRKQLERKAPLARNRPGPQLVLPNSRAAAVPAVHVNRSSGKPAGEVVYAPGWKLTVCPSPAVLGPAAHVAVQPGDEVRGAGFAALGPGRYLEEAMG